MSRWLLCPLLCTPTPVGRDGADHTGRDVWLRCKECGRQTINHIECERWTPEAHKVLKREWRWGKTTMENQP